MYTSLERVKITLELSVSYLKAKQCLFYFLIIYGELKYQVDVYREALYTRLDIDRQTFVTS